MKSIIFSSILAIAGSAAAAPALQSRQEAVCTVAADKPWGTCCVPGEVVGLPEPIWNCMLPSEDFTTAEELVAACGENWEPLCCTAPEPESQISWAESACVPVA